MPPHPDKPDIIVLWVDSVSPAMVSPSVTPNLWRLHQQGVCFTQAINPAPHTIGCCCTLFGGTYPSGHHHFSYLEAGYYKPVFPESVFPLQKHLRAEGYSIGGYTIETYYPSSHAKDADMIAEEIRAFRKTTQPPRYMDIWLSRFHDRFWQLQPRLPSFLDATDLLHEFDATEVAKIMSVLDLENDLVVLMSDHGDIGPLKEINIRTIFNLIYQKKWPGFRAIGNLVAFVDVFPTIAELVCNERPMGLRGESLVPLIEGKEQKQREYPLEMCLNKRHNRLIGRYGSACFGYRTERHKYIVDLYGGEELYDLWTDKAETHNLANQHPELCGFFHQKVTSALNVDLAFSTYSTRPMLPADYFTERRGPHRFDSFYTAYLEYNRQSKERVAQSSRHG